MLAVLLFMFCIRVRFWPAKSLVFTLKNRSWCILFCDLSWAATIFWVWHWHNQNDADSDFLNKILALFWTRKICDDNLDYIIYNFGSSSTENHIWSTAVTFIYARSADYKVKCVHSRRINLCLVLILCIRIIAEIF